MNMQGAIEIQRLDIYVILNVAVIDVYPKKYYLNSIWWKDK